MLFARLCGNLGPQKLNFDVSPKAALRREGHIFSPITPPSLFPQIPHYHPYLADRHLVGGEGAGFVGADDRGTAEGLDRGQRAHDGVLLGHTAGSEGEAGGDDSRQTLGDGGHGQRHSDLEVVDGALLGEGENQS